MIDLLHNPLLILAIGIVTVVGMIIVLRVNAFIALITAALLVSLLSPGDWGGKMERVAASFGGFVGRIGIVIAMAAVIGKCLMDSGAADRIVRSFVGVLGERRAPEALCGASFVLAVPVFFDTVFYLMVPLARSLWRTTRKNYMLYILAIATGGVVTHGLVPPTPGPLVMAANLGFDIGTMILVGAMIGAPAAVVGLLAARLFNRWQDVPCRPYAGEEEAPPLGDEELPGLAISLAPILLPVLLISGKTITGTLAEAEHRTLVRQGDVFDWPALAGALAESHEPDTPAPLGRLAEWLPAELTDALARAHAQGSIDAELAGRVQEAVAGWVDEHDPLFDPAFAGTSLGKPTERLLDRGAMRLPAAERERFQEHYRAAVLEGVLPSETSRRMVRQVLAQLSDAERRNFDYLVLEAALPALARQTWRRRAADVAALLGDANLALLISGALAMAVLKRSRGLSLGQLAKSAETALMSGGVIILITSAGGAFGEMLKMAGVGKSVENLFAQSSFSTGTIMLLIGFVVAALLKIAQGSSTVAMITTSAMMASMGASAEMLGFHPVYLATAIAGGSLVCSWMNDSGFWIVARMSALSETETLKSWTVLLVVIGVAILGFTFVAANLLPLA